MDYYDYDDLVDEYYGGGGYLDFQFGGHGWEADLEEEDYDDEENESDAAATSSKSVESLSSIALSTIKTPKDNVYSLQLDRYEIFKAQDTEKGHFDVSIEVGEKKLHAHKFFLASASEYFSAILSERWDKTNDRTFKIENPDYSYDDVYQLITFIYSGSCTITNVNVFVLTDMSEFYGIQLLKDRCIEYLSLMKVCVEDAEKMVELAERYSLAKFIESLKEFIKNHFKELIEAEHFLDYKKPFIQFMSTVEKSCKIEESFFDAAYKWAQHYATLKGLEVKDEKFDCEEFIKKELDGILGNIKFSNMTLKFVKDSILEKGFLFSSKEMYKIILKSKRCNDDEDECFKTLYETAKLVSKKEWNTTENGDYDEADELIIREMINNELADILRKVNFSRMSIKFLMEFVVEQQYSFSFTKLHQYLLNHRKIKKEEAFKSVYQLAEKQVLLKQNAFPDAKFCLINSVKKELIDVLSRIEFSQMSVAFWMEFGIEKGFTLLPSDFHSFFHRLRWNYCSPHELFKVIYDLAEKQVFRKKAISKDENFNIYDVIKYELTQVLPCFEFSKMKLEFLLEFVVGKGLLLSPTILKDYFLHYYDSCEKSFVTFFQLAQKRAAENPIFLQHHCASEKPFKAVYQLAQKQATEKQKRSKTENFNLVNAIKDELVETIPVVEFCHMSKKFLNDFVVKNGILSEDQARHVSYVCLEVQSDGTKISGIFDDIYGIMKAIPSNGYFTTPKQWNKLRFALLKCKIPSSQSTVQKMKGVEWYLCLERDGILTIKFHSLIATNDFLIAEMKTSEDFMFSTDEPACLKACYNNI